MSKDFQYKPTPEFDAWLAEKGPLNVSAEIAELENAQREGLTERVIDDYDSKTEASLWAELKQHSERKRRWLFGAWPNNTALCFHLQTRMLKHVLRSDRQCKTVVDFGALYAKPDADIAGAFPDVTVHGIDRSQNVKQMNEAAFPGHSNLHFTASDITQFIRDHDVRGAVLVHVRTSICILPKAMELLYAQCAASGIRHIILIELTGYSHQLRRFYEFSDEPAPSAVLRQSMFIHNYPSMLKAAGYEIAAAEMYKSPMPKALQRDTHLIAIHAKKAN